MSVAENIHPDGLVKNATLLAIICPGALRPFGERVSMRIASASDSLAGVRPVVCDDHDLDALARPSTIALVLHEGPSGPVDRINMALGSMEVPTLFAAREGGSWRVGPWYMPGHTACWQCAETTRRFFPRGPQADGDFGEAEEAGIDRIVSALASILDGRSALIDGAVETRGGRQHVLKDPLCPACSIWSRRPIEALHVH